MNIVNFRMETVTTYDAICDYCGDVIATECRSFNDVVHKAANGTQFNGEGNYKCCVCSKYKERNGH